ncbi:MAG: aminomethyl-transferring glycine dehydrogenase subunit GcvPB [Candidatus Melainabacteria bacterium]|nr:aminomethyl-transferring glycine dehydrogenase subunit GcvPB [Candidatus Melainabacteria bacterium]
MSTAHSLLEPLIFEASSPGHQGVSLPASGVPERPLQALLPQAWLRKKPAQLPEVSQLETVRHFTRLSQLNHCIDTGFYPLGSCTMKYNPKVCDTYNQLEGFTALHPMAPEHLCQGTLGLMYRLQHCLMDITGFDAVTLQPAAGAQGELVGMMMVQSYFRQKNDTARTEVIIPDSAHGTNPASAGMCGFDVKELRSDPKTGRVDLEKLAKLLSHKTAALMLTNPSTLGLFESDILTISQLVHDAGGLMYYDGANLNAVMGQARPADMGFDVMHINTHKTFATPHGGGGPGSGPVAVNRRLEAFLPSPIVTFDGIRYGLDWDRPHSIGQVKAFYGNVEMMVRAYAYILAHGASGLAQVSEDAVLNANYLRARLSQAYHVPYNTVCKHEFILDSSRQHAQHEKINTMTLAKRLMDFGFHPPTVYFPLIVHEAMMIEPTETESKATLDRFVEAMLTIAEECQQQPERVIQAPHTTPVSRVDEVVAAKKLDLNYFLTLETSSGTNSLEATLS